MKITACPKCGSRKIFQGRLKEGVLTGYTDKHVCRDCGFQGSPLIFDTIEEYHKFQKEKKSEGRKGMDNKNQDPNEEVELSKKEKEMIDFLDGIDNEKKVKPAKTTPKKEKPKKETKDKKEFNVVKNSFVGLSIVLIVTSIWIAARGGLLTMYGTSLLIVGIILFIVGMLSGKDKDEEFKSSKPTFGGIFLMMAGILGSFSWFQAMYLLDEGSIDQSFIDQFGLGITLETLMSSVLICLSIVAIFSILSVIGGLFAIKRKNYNLTLICGFLGLLAIGPFFSSTILAFAGLFFIIKSKEEFEK